jgi:RNA-binding protein
MWEQEAISHCERETLENSRLRKLKTRSRATKPTVWIGKEGASEDLVRQVENQLRTRELVKLKLQRSTLAKFETFEVAEEIAASTGSTLVDVIGHTFTLYKKDKPTRTIRKRPNVDMKGSQVN